jgi:hypothetical protein
MAKVNNPDMTILVGKVVGRDVLVLNSMLPQGPQDLPDFLADINRQIIGLVTEPLRQSGTYVFHLNVGPLVSPNDAGG